MPILSMLRLYTRLSGTGLTTSFFTALPLPPPIATSPQPAPHSETLNVSTFHWIYDQVMHYREMLMSDKRGGASNRRALQASRRLELSVAAYREFLRCVTRMTRLTSVDRHPDGELGETEESVAEALRVQASAAETIIGGCCRRCDFVCFTACVRLVRWRP